MHNKISYDDIFDEYYKTSWVRILPEEGEVYYELNSGYIAEKYKQYISPAQYEWLIHIDKNVKITEDAAITIPIEKLRENIIYVEKFKERYPDFTGIDDVKSALKWYGKLY